MPGTVPDPKETTVNRTGRIPALNILRGETAVNRGKERKKEKGKEGTEERKEGGWRQGGIGEERGKKEGEKKEGIEGGKEGKFQVLIHVIKKIISVNITENSCESGLARMADKGISKKYHLS